jgi:DNA-binding NarL/FixJ family response regulator
MQEVNGSAIRMRVLVVDDHLMVRQGLKAILNAYADIELVGEAGNGEEAVRLVDQLRPAVVVMDLNLPMLDGIEATRQIKSRYPETIVIGLSVNPTKENDEAFQRAGAARLLTKEAAVEQLYEAMVEITKPQ